MIIITLFHWATIAALLVLGDDKNSLHTSALAWSFGAYIAIMTAFLYGVAVDLKNFYANNKQP